MVLVHCYPRDVKAVASALGNHSIACEIVHAFTTVLVTMDSISKCELLTYSGQLLWCSSLLRLVLVVRMLRGGEGLHMSMVNGCAC